jgi:signal transduction histidine kinase
VSRALPLEKALEPERSHARPVARWRTLRWRLTTWYAAVFGIGLVLLAVGSLVMLSLVLEQRSDRYLRAAWRAFATELLVEASEFASADRAIAMTQEEVNFEDTEFLVTPDLRHHETPSGDTRAIDEPPLPPSRATVSLTTRDGPRGGTRLAIGAVAFHGRDWTVVAEHPRSALTETVNAVALGYALALPLVLGVALVGGYGMARRALAPVASMARRARAIEVSTLHDRLPIGDPQDELGELAGVINGLLERLDLAFQQQRRLVADMSHELRTPVATLLAEMDVLLARRGRPEDEYRERVAVLRAAAVRLTRLVDDLFLLSRADSKQMPIRPELLHFDELLAETVRSMEALASRHDISLVLDVASDISTHSECDADTWPHGAGGAIPGALISGDPALLGRLLLNLLDNAIKYSPRGGRVRVALNGIPGHGRSSIYVMRVTDEGPGIAPDAQPFIFDRFFREDAARTRMADPMQRRSTDDQHGLAQAAADTASENGAGLGLSIARWIAEIHGGTLELERSSPDGTTMCLRLPATT